MLTDHNLRKIVRKMSNRSNTKLHAGYRRIPGYSNYAMNRFGEIYRIDTNVSLVPQRTTKTHWSGRVGLRNNRGERRFFNLAQLLESTFGITSPETLANNLL